MMATEPAAAVVMAEAPSAQSDDRTRSADSYDGRVAVSPTVAAIPVPSTVVAGPGGINDWSRRSCVAKSHYLIINPSEQTIGRI